MKTNKQIKKEITKLIDELVIQHTKPNCRIKRLIAIHKLLQDIEADTYKKMTLMRILIHTKIKEEHKL